MPSGAYKLFIPSCLLAFTRSLPRRDTGHAHPLKGYALCVSRQCLALRLPQSFCRSAGVSAEVLNEHLFMA